jgi:catechol 2,3-dioxygenase-like lactoylglutathione lyase family enzyme
MAEKEALVVYAPPDETVEAALADAAVTGQENGKPHVATRLDRPHIRVIPEWFGGGTLPRKELHEAAEQLTIDQAGLIEVGEPSIEKGLDTAFTGAARVVKRAVEATTNEITSELGEAFKEADMVDMHFEVDIIPVSDVDRAKQFYQSLGWRLDADDSPLPGLRIVQFTPPGSAASVTFGTGLTAAAPGSAEGGLTVSDIVAAHDELTGRGIDTSDVWHGPPFPVEVRQPGPDPEHTSYGSFCSFTDPDGNTWLVQEVTTRRPGV